jgi:hypothetical protein
MPCTLCGQEKVTQTRKNEQNNSTLWLREKMVGIKNNSESNEFRKF